MKNPPLRSKTTIRPYIGESLLNAARSSYPQLAVLSDREFVEFALTQLMLASSDKASVA